MTFALLLLAFAVGALPSRVVIGRIWGVDLTEVGSGNAGAGNATRTIGLGPGVVMAVLDGLKGLLPVLVGRSVGLEGAPLALVGLAAVAGNNWPIHLRARGGRGLAASVGVVLAFDPLLLWWPAVWAAIGWRIGGGLGGFVGWACLPFVTVAAGAPAPTMLLAGGLSAMMVVRRAQGNHGFDRTATVSRVLFDDDRHIEAGRPTWARPSVVLAGLLVIPAYVVLAWWVLGRSGDHDIGASGIGLLGLGIACEFAAKWAFGELFREGITSSGRPIRRSSAFRAALVGSGVARLIPAGGAVTPLAMAWSVRRESSGAAGAALRVTVLSYGALLLATGGGFLWAATWFPDTRARPQSAAAGVIMMAMGMGLITGAARLDRLTRFVPSRWRGRVAATVDDRRLTARSVAMLTARVGLEAAALGLTLQAFGIHLSPSRTLAVFGASQLVGGLPGTPGGIGYTEAGLAGALAFFGVRSALAPIVVFRFISYWLPAIAGLSAGAYGFLQARPGTDAGGDSRP